jgi:hypothetical protein
MTLSKRARQGEPKETDMSKQEAIRHAVALWESEDRTYWKHIRAKVVDDALMDFYGVLPRAAAEAA